MFNVTWLKLDKQNGHFLSQVMMHVQESRGLKHPFMDLAFGLKIGPNLDDSFLKLDIVFYWVRRPKIW
jgi:hypothetical protein